MGSRMLVDVLRFEPPLGRVVSGAAATVVTDSSDVSVTAVESVGSSLEHAARTVTAKAAAAAVVMLDPKIVVACWYLPRGGRLFNVMVFQRVPPATVPSGAARPVHGFWAEAYCGGTG